MTGTPLPPPPMFNNGKKVDNPNPVLPTFPSNKQVEKEEVLVEENSLEVMPLEEEAKQEETVKTTSKPKKEKKPFFSKKTSKNENEETEVINEKVLTVDETKPVTATDFDVLLRKPENEKTSEGLLEEKVPNKNRKLGMGVFGGLSVILIGAIVYAVGTINGLF